MSERFEYRIVWQREGLKRATAIRQTIRGAELYVGHLNWSESKEARQRYEDESNLYADMPKLLSVEVQRRPVGDWEMAARDGEARRPHGVGPLDAAMRSDGRAAMTLARTPLARKGKKPRKRKAPGTKCAISKCRRDQVVTIDERRYCPLHGADKLFAANVRGRGFCEVAPWFPKQACAGELQCSHLVSRRYKAVRWYEGNAVASCAGHHLYTTLHPLEWERAIDDNHRPNWLNLRGMALSYPPDEPLDVIERLKEAA